MVFVSNWLCAITISLFAAVVQSQVQETTTKPPFSANDQSGAIVAEEVVVESSLNVRNPAVSIRRRTRGLRSNILRTPGPLSHIEPKDVHVRSARQLNSGPNAFYPQQNSLYPQPFYQPNNYDSSQSTAQSNSHSHANGPFGSQNADALAAAQAFQTNGPSGSFGATSNNANTQTLGIGLNGAGGGFSNSGGQTYNLPNGQTLNIAYNNGASFTPFGPSSTSQGSSIAFGG